jgi:hypothetical protein
MLTQAQAQLYSLANGARTIRDCLAASSIEAEPETLQHFAREFFVSLWEKSYLHFRFPTQQGQPVSVL